MADNLLPVLGALYNQRPDLFTEEQVDTLQQNAFTSGLPFQRNYESSDINLGNTVKQLVGGFIEGFSTFDVLDSAPKNSVEEIARGLGGLLGFIGIIPGLGSATSLMTKGIASSLRLAGLGSKIATGTKLAGALTKTAQFKSVPMFVADMALKTTKSLLKSPANEAIKFITKGGTQYVKGAEIFKDVVSAGTHLGFASATSAWRGGVDEMMSAFGHGAVTGGVFRGLGNLLPSKNLPTGNIWKDFTNNIKEPKGLARILASSFESGISSTMANAPLELQVYNYLLGGYFGINEMSINQRKALETMQKVIAPLDGSANNVILGRYRLNSFPQTEEFKKLDPEVQAEIKHQIDKDLGGFKYKQFQDGTIEEIGIGGIQIAKDAVKVVEEQLRDPNLSITDRFKLMEKRIGLDIMTEAQRRYTEKVEQYKKDNPDLLKKLGEEGLLNEKKDQFFDDALENAWIDAGKEANMAYETIKQHQEEVNQFEQKYKEWESSQIGKSMSDLSNYLQSEKQLSLGFRNTIRDIAINSFDNQIKMDNLNAEDGLKLIERQREIADFIANAVQSKRNGVDTAITDLWGVFKSKYLPKDNKIRRELWNNLKRAYDKEVQLSPMKQQYWDYDVRKFVDLGENDLSTQGNNVTIYKASPFYKTILEEQIGDIDYKIIKRVRRGAPEREDYDLHSWKLDDAGGEIEYNDVIYDMAIQAHKEGRIIPYGIKDSGEVISHKYIIPTLNEAKQYLQNVSKITERLGIKENWENDIKNAFEFTYEANDWRASQKELAEMYTMQVANSLKILELTNKLTTEQVIRGIKDGVLLNTPAKRNKRTSLENNGFIRWDAEFFKDVEGVTDNSLNVVITNAVNKTGNVEGKSNLKMHIVKDGKLKEVDVDTHYDGIVTLRDDVYNSMVLTGGLDHKSSTQKGTLVTAEEGLGMLMGKYAYHKASKTESESMRKNNIHAMLNDTSAKQLGYRNKLDKKWVNGEWKFYKDGKETSIGAYSKDVTSPNGKYYKVPIKDFTYTEGGEHSERQFRDGTYKTQALSGVDERMPNANKFWHKIIRDVVLGDAEQNKLYQRWEKVPSSVDINDIDVTKLSAQYKLDIIYGGKDTPLYRKLVKEYLRKFKEDPLGEDEEAIWTDQSEAYRKALESEISVADKLLTLWDYNPTLLFSSALQNYVNKIISSRILSEVRNPRAEHSWTSVLKSYTEELQTKFDLKPGQAILDATLKNKKIPWFDNQLITIKEALDAYNKAIKEEPTQTTAQQEKVPPRGSNELTEASKIIFEEEPSSGYKQRIADMEDYLSIVFQRVPTDSNSGMRVIKVIGFTDLEGTGAVLHPKDMANLGGADLDIDKAFAYAGIPKEVKAEYKAVENEWYDYYRKGADDKAIKVSAEELAQLGKAKIDELVEKGELYEVFQEAKPKDNPFERSVSDLEKQVMGHKAPSDMQTKLIGEGTGTRKYNFSLLSPTVMLRVNEHAHNGNTLLGVGINQAKIIQGVLDDARITSPALRRKLRELKRTLINSSADSADGIPLASGKDIPEIFLNGLSSVATPKEREILENLIGKKSQTKYAYRDLNRAINGRDGFYNILTLDKIIQELNTQNTLLGVKDYANPFFQIAKYIGNLNVQKYGEVITKSSWFGENLNAIGEARYKGDFRKIVLGRRGQIKYYNDFRNSPSYQRILLTQGQFKANQYANELKFQSVADLASAELINDYLPPGWNQISDTIVMIRDKAHALKEEYRSQLQEVKEKSRDLQKSTRKSALMKFEEAVNKERETIPPTYRKLFDAYLISSIKPRSEGYDAYIRRRTKEDKTLEGMRYAIDVLKAKLKNSNEPENLTIIQSKVAEKQAEYDKLLHERKQEYKRAYHSTNFDTFPLEIKSISNEVIQKFGKKITEITTLASEPKLTKEQLAGIDKYIESDQLTPDMQVKDYRVINDTFLKRAKILSKEESINDPEIAKASKVITEFLSKHPEWIADIEARFSGELYRQMGTVSEMAGTITPQIANKQDYLMFANTLDAIMKRKELPKELKWYHYFMFPATIADDLDLENPNSTTTKPTLVTTTNNFSALKEVKVLQSAFTKNYQVWNYAQDLIERSINKVNNYYDESEIAIAKKQLDEEFDGLGSKLFSLTVRRREKNLGNKSIRKIAKENNVDVVFSDKPILNSKGEEVYGRFERAKESKDPNAILGAIKLNTKKLKEVYAKGLEEGKLTARVDGVVDLPIDLFKDYDSWERFVYLHERAHAYNKQNQGESKADYENRMNQIALQEYDKPIELKTELYEQRWKEVESIYNDYLKDETDYKVPKLNKTMKAREVLDMYDKELTNWSKKVAQEYVTNKRAEEEFFSRHKDLEMIDNQGYLNLDNIKRGLTRDLFSGKTKNLGWNFIERLVHQEKLEKIKVDVIKYFNSVDKVSKGEEYQSLEDIKNRSKSYKQGVIGNEIFKRKHAIMWNLVNDGRDFTTMGEVRKKDKVVFANDIEFLKTTNLNHNDWMNFKDTDYTDWMFDTYFPHMDFDKKELSAWLKRNMEKQWQQAGNVNEMIKARAKIFKESLEGDENYRGLEEYLNESLYSLDYIDEKNIMAIRPKAGHTLTRHPEDPTPGWSTDMNVLKMYETKINRSYFNAVASFINRKNIDSFISKNQFGGNTKSWAFFMADYNRRNLGMPTLYPESIMRDVDYKIPTAYYSFTDQFYRDKFGKIAKKFFGNKDVLKAFQDIPRDVLDKMSEREKRELEKLYDADFTKKINWLSQLEGKWQLTSLLFHSKAFINNIIGGSQNTIASAGLRHFMKANDVEYLKNNIFLDFKSKEDIQKFIEENGGIESYYKNEVMLNPKIRANKKLKEFAEDIVEMVKKRKGSYDEIEAKLIQKRYGISDNLLETAGFFMRKSEVMLRTRAWMAHYLRAREVLNANGVTLEKDHPWLIQMANKGVWGTQFLYNTANRPAFASTTMGKVFSRFQLYAWNSIKLRKDLFKMADSVGWDTNDDSVKKLQRIMGMDLVILALAGIFPTTMFESALPPPFNYFSDLTSYIFGDEEERNNAFFGALPYPANILNIVSPPSSRVAFNTLNFIISGDGDKLAHNLWSWFPFGRMAKSMYNTIDTPAMMVENFTGLPTHRMNSYLKKLEKKEEPVGKIISPLGL